jgi:3-dehydroquinate synthase
MTLRNVLIPAAGRGARLDRPETPKPLVEVGGQPLILRLLNQLEDVGVKRAVVVTGWEGAKIERALTNHPELTSLEVDFVENEEWERGLASSVVAGREAMEGEEPFLLAMSDHRFDEGLVDAMARSQLDSKEAVRMLIDRDIDGVYDVDGAVKVQLSDVDETSAGRIDGLGLDLEDPDAVDAGLFVAGREVFDACETALEEQGAADLTDALRRLTGEETDAWIGYRDVDGANWFDVDTPPALIRAEMDDRDKKRTEAVHRPEFDLSEASQSHEYSFVTGSPSETDVVVQRGFVRNPSQLQLIPEESASSPIYVFTDTRVNRLYGDDFVGGLKDLGYDVERIVMAEGEESKTLENYVQMAKRVLGEGIDERSVLISLGGGAVCNVCGFLASTLYRGIGLVHVPTTLMAQCDAAIGHKQAVNGKHGKNHIGSYYPPIRIAVDIEVLQTLEDWLIPDGLSEVVKHALGQDRDYLEYLLDYDGELRNPDFLEHVVRKNIELKCRLMATDPKEHREALVLQYGHEVGHPIEYLSGYGLNHGQSIGIGMMVSARVAQIMRGEDDTLVDLHREVIEKYELPTRIPEDMQADDIIAMTRYNKKYLMEGTRMALIDEPGELWKVNGEYGIPVPDDVIREAVDASY